MTVNQTTRSHPGVATGRRNQARPEGRMPAPVALAAALGLDLLLAAVFALAHPAVVPAVLVLALAAGALSWWTTVPGALGVGALGWLFYSGFVTHTQGQLGGLDLRDGIVAAILLGAGLLAAGTHAGLSRLMALRSPAALPQPRTPLD
jgi:hypothetical protein